MLVSDARTASSLLGSSTSSSMAFHHACWTDAGIVSPAPKRIRVADASSVGRLPSHGVGVGVRGNAAVDGGEAAEFDPFLLRLCSGEVGHERARRRSVVQHDRRCRRRW